MSLKLYNTLFVGKVLINVPSLKSTNNYAINLLTKSKPTDGTVVFTPNQTSGRGQYGSSWEAEAGKNITLSIIFHPSFLGINDQFYLNIFTSLGILDFLHKIIPNEELSIKWPNDIYVSNNKLGGVLIQNTMNSKILKSSVIGIGLNVNQTAFNSDAPNPTSLKLIANKDFMVEGLVQDLLQCIEARYLQLKAGKKDQLKMDYLGLLYRFDQVSSYERKDGSKFNGKIKNVAASGQLLVLNIDNEQEESFFFKEIKFILQ